MGKKIYVGNLSFNTNEDELISLFANHGTVETAKIITDRDSGRSKGFAFVEMGSDDEAKNAIESLNGTEHNGRSLNISEAKPMAPREKRGGGGGGFRNNRY